MTGFELDRIELGYPAAVCAAVENTATMWRTGWWESLCRYATDPACPMPPWHEPAHVSPWGAP